MEINHYLYAIATVDMGLHRHPGLVEVCEKTATILAGLQAQFAMD
jgi:hypothetical protein